MSVIRDQAWLEQTSLLMSCIPMLHRFEAFLTKSIRLGWVRLHFATTSKNTSSLRIVSIVLYTAKNLHFGRLFVGRLSAETVHKVQKIATKRDIAAYGPPCGMQTIFGQLCIRWDKRSTHSSVSSLRVSSTWTTFVFSPPVFSLLVFSPLVFCFFLFLASGLSTSGEDLCECERSRRRFCT